jgi:phosphoribosylglycinamide formyltransferase 1
MNKRYSVYCSGGASRIFSFYKKNCIYDYPIESILYDGHDKIVIDKLNILFGKKLVVFQKKEGLSEKLLSVLELKNIDYVFCFGKRILKGDLLSKYKNKIINFHPSLLPAFPGVNSIDKALNSSVQILGNTAHFIDEGIDTGPIIMQSVISKAYFKCYEDVLSLQLKMLKKIWSLLEKDKIRVTKNKVTIDEVTNKNTFFSI